MKQLSGILTVATFARTRGFRRIAHVLANVATVFLLNTSAWGDDKLPVEQVRFFESKVRPLLAEHCWKCHGPDMQKGKLRLDSRGTLLAGGESGAAIVVGKPDESLLMEAVRYQSFEMPPSGKLSAAQIEILATWIKLGAPWPGSDATVAAPQEKKKGFTDADRQWWAFQPLRREPPPDVADAAWVRNDVDRFVLAQLKQQGLTPTVEADRETLIRRLSFDLIGLPPSPREVDEFVKDSAPQAYERLVDRLLDSPRYGERWARHWLDLVRYADSDGYRIDQYRPHAWRYRDYVIQSLNDDKPYDRFVQEQLAGDELFPDSPEALVATGYLRQGIYEYNSRDVPGQWDIILNEITDTTGDVFLGLGMQCARCHDHKFDPILQRDYFRLRAFFESLSLRDDQVALTAEQLQQARTELQPWEEATAALREELAQREAPYREQGRREAIRRFPEDIQQMIRKPAPVSVSGKALAAGSDQDQDPRLAPRGSLPAAGGADVRTPREQQLVELAWRQVDFEYGRIDDKFKPQDKEAILSLRRELAKFDDRRPAPLPLIYSVSDVGPAAPPTVIPKKRNEVEPGFLTLLDDKPAEIIPPHPPMSGKALAAGPDQAEKQNQNQNQNSRLAPRGSPDLETRSTGRRSALARWITRADNPLSTRVIVNRVWQSHFGRGLAANSSDFGRLGDPPTHPELLDWLTAQFLDGGWRLKSLHRLIVTSATYRQSTKHAHFAEHTLKDPTNRWYWRADTRRLDAEQIRDAILAVTGRLDLGTHMTTPSVSGKTLAAGPSQNQNQNENQNQNPRLAPRGSQDFHGGPGVAPDQPRRSIYTRVMRNSRDPLLESFDLPLFFSSAASRDTTTSPIQSLLLINSQVMLRYANTLAEQAKKPFAANDPAAAVREVFRRAWGREPSPDELTQALAFLDSQSAQIGQMPDRTADLARLPTGKMPYRDGQSVMLEPTLASQQLLVPHQARLDVADFTIEAYFQIRSVYDSGAVRTIAAKSDGDRAKPGWAFGVTGKGSRRKPQTLVLQLFGENVSGHFGEAALFSDQNIELNKPYYAAASVQLAGDKRSLARQSVGDAVNSPTRLASVATTGEQSGSVTFFLKDLSNDDEPLLTARIEHSIRGGFGNREPLSIGRLSSTKPHLFDGLIDDVRLSQGTLATGDLLFTKEGIAPATIGYWQFESEPGVLHDGSPHALNIEPTVAKSHVSDSRWLAFVDLCHVLLNSNQFLYVH